MQFLKQLYSINSYSDYEEKIRNYILDWIDTNVPDAVYKVDKIGNILILKGDSETYPCLAAHLDEVHLPQKRRIVTQDNMIFGENPEGSRVGIGADDKNGIWIVLNALKKYPVMKAVLFVSEEIGCVGSGKVDMEFFSDCRFVIEADRRGNSDLITIASGVCLCSDDFIDCCGYKGFGYHKERGINTDVRTLVRRGINVSCLNLSCGYYNPHTSEEYTVIDDLKNCYDFVCHIIENLTDVYPV